MGRKVRKQINIDEAHETVLKLEAERLGISESEVIRRALDAMVAGEAEARRAEAITKHAELLAALDERRARTGPGSPYDFRREDAYEERLKPYDNI